jgi:hypothetical protein
MGGLLNRVGGGLGLLFSGPDDPRLSAYDNAMARRLGIMRSGIGLLGAETGTPTLQALAQGALLGQMSGMGQRGAMVEQQATALQQAQRDAIRYGMAEALGMGDMSRAVQLAALTGDANTVNSIVNYIKSQQKLETTPEKGWALTGTGGIINTLAAERAARGDAVDEKELWIVRPPDQRRTTMERVIREDGKDIRVLFDATTGERISVLGEAEPSGSGGFPSWMGRAPQPVVDTSTGREYMGVWNPGTMSFEEVPDVGPALSEGQRQARGMARMLDAAYARIASMDVPTLREKLASRTGMFGMSNYFNTPEGRQFRNAALGFLIPALSAISGKTVTEQEVERNEALYIGQPGDDEATIMVKNETMRLMRDAVRSMARLPVESEEDDENARGLVNMLSGISDPDQRLAALQRWAASRTRIDPYR